MKFQKYTFSSIPFLIRIALSGGRKKIFPEIRYLHSGTNLFRKITSTRRHLGSIIIHLVVLTIPLTVLRCPTLARDGRAYPHSSSVAGRWVVIFRFSDLPARWFIYEILLRFLFPCGAFPCRFSTGRRKKIPYFMHCILFCASEEAGNFGGWMNVPWKILTYLKKVT